MVLSRMIIIGARGQLDDGHGLSWSDGTLVVAVLTASSPYLAAALELLKFLLNEWRALGVLGGKGVNYLPPSPLLLVKNYSPTLSLTIFLHVTLERVCGASECQVV